MKVGAGYPKHTTRSSYRVSYVRHHGSHLNRDLFRVMDHRGKYCRISPGGKQPLSAFRHQPCQYDDGMHGGSPPYTPRIASMRLPATNLSGPDGEASARVGGIAVERHRLLETARSSKYEHAGVGGILLVKGTLAGDISASWWALP